MDFPSLVMRLVLVNRKERASPLLFKDQSTEPLETFLGILSKVYD